MRDNLGQVSRLVAAEVTSLRHQCEREKETAQRMKTDADNVSLFKQWRTQRTRSNGISQIIVVNLKLKKILCHNLIQQSKDRTNKYN